MHVPEFRKKPILQMQVPLTAELMKFNDILQLVHTIMLFTRMATIQPVILKHVPDTFKSAEAQTH